jgi:hypothetical protein
MTTLLNRTDREPDQLALIQSEPISMQWNNELQRNIGQMQRMFSLASRRETLGSIRRVVAAAVG